MSESVPTIGIRREDKHEWERRVPLTPNGVRRMVDEGLKVVVQPSPIRAFPDEAYEAAGAALQEDISACDVVFAVKEIPAELFREGGVYVFFSHTIKGQAHNMPLLQRLLDLGCTLVDYERIVDEQGRRLVFFGRHAGLAGMIDTLWVLGRRLAAKDVENPFTDLRLAHHYRDLGEARQAVAAVGERIEREGLPDLLAPMTVGFAGYGNVSRGAQEILDLLPVQAISPDELSSVTARPMPRRDRLYKIVFEERHMVAPKDDGQAFDLKDYYARPERYRSIMEPHLDQLSLFVNCIYWTERYPRVVTHEYLKRAFAKKKPPRLQAIGDISCDIDGGVQCTVKATTPGQPAYVFDPATGEHRDGWEGPGLAMMTTDCLPCELPREASSSFTEALLPFVRDITTMDIAAAHSYSKLPDAVRKATVVWRGELTPDYRYLEEHLPG